MIDPSQERTSDRLMSLAAPHWGERVAIGDMVTVLGDRGFGLLLLILTLPNAVPGPAIPGLSAVLGLPLAVLAAQIALGLERPKLPALLSRRSIRHDHLTAFLHRADPWLRRLETWLRPRHSALTRGAAIRLLGAACFLFSLVLSLPIPMGNMPVAWALILIAAGMLEEDGLVIGIGLVGGLAAVAWNGLLIFVGERALEAAGRLLGF